MGGVSRRRVLTAAAWSLPVVAVGAAAPAMAASPFEPPPFDLQFTGTACKYPGNSGPIRKGYRFGVTSSHNAPYPIVLVVRGFTVNGVPASQVRFWNISPPQCLSTCFVGGLAQLCVPAGVTLNYDIVAGPYQNSENGLARVTYDLYRGDTCEPEVIGLSATTLPNSLPPC
jgi:hypothetical protein